MFYVIFIIILTFLSRIRNYNETGKHLGPKVASSGRVQYQDIIFDNEQEDEFNANTLHVDSSDEEEN